MLLQSIIDPLYLRSSQQFQLFGLVIASALFRPSDSNYLTSLCEVFVSKG